MRVFGTEILASGATPCAVCGGRLRGAVFKLPDGRVWCVRRVREAPDRLLRLGGISNGILEGRHLRLLNLDNVRSMRRWAVGPEGLALALISEWPYSCRCSRE